MITLNCKMNIAWLKKGHNIDRLWESIMMRHSRVVLSGCLKARRLCSVWLGHSGLSTVRNATGTHGSAFLRQSLSAATHLIRCCDCLPARLRLTTRWGIRAKSIIKQQAQSVQAWKWTDIEPAKSPLQGFGCLTKQYTVRSKWEEPETKKRFQIRKIYL